MNELTICNDAPLAERHILIEGNEEPGSVRAILSDPGTGTVNPGPLRISRDDLVTEIYTTVPQVTSQGHIKCAHDGWHNVIAFSGVSTLLLVIIIALWVTKRIS